MVTDITMQIQLAGMVYFDYGQGRYVCREPTIIPDIRAHVGNWEHFHNVCGVWPVLSILTFLFRFVFVLSIAVWAVWYGLSRHGWAGDRYYLVSLSIAVPLMILWFFVERAAWNYDLRRCGISSHEDLWSVTQFPPRNERLRTR
jgi:RsiW-degrading membrane proteinase PrsW (M82 family)